MSKNKHSKSSLSWKAIRRGTIRCAPACGRGCTQDEYLKAKARGKWMARTLGKGWKIYVWENLGWHSKAISPCGRIKVHDDRLSRNHYVAYLGEAQDMAGGNWAESGSTPKAAVENVLKVARREFNRISGILKGL